ncbi:hypothetical protein [Arthrobacter sp. MMS18-M83]|uniref:hypothetical protein n=1 Tax=Arthrobacter sp. MMS18-M83 TaxID=2996261 RepID=UPI00227A3729|nr:hypothetical protein [Arthrobacter sp. MMS18-M83]WAH98783.1 hypothetical protein OW521_08125 [Arthrobacter sp. MMS18-M83]
MLAMTTLNATSAITTARTKIDEMIVRYDGWFLVLLAVLMVLAFSLLAAMAIWCLTQGRGRFTGNWSWNQWGVSMFVECR